MSMGLAATTAAIIKLTLMFYQSFSGDLLRNLLIVNMWCKLEEVIGITAASIPYLKSPIERLFQRVRLIVPVGRHELWFKGNSCLSIHPAVREDDPKSNSTSEGPSSQK
jgi:hypothetical protein